MAGGYTDLSDEDKLAEAIQFVARGADMPPELEAFLHDNDLYDLILGPTGDEHDYNGSTGGDAD